MHLGSINNWFVVHLVLLARHSYPLSERGIRVSGQVHYADIVHIQTVDTYWMLQTVL